MIRLQLDETWRPTDLSLFVEPVEIYDPSGKFIGLFVPANLQRGKEIYAQAEAQFDRAEIERRMQSPEPGIPLGQVNMRLRQLEAEATRREAAGEVDWTTEEAMTYFRSLRDAGAKLVR